MISHDTVDIVIIEDDPVIRDWLATVINSSPGFSCVGQYGDGDAALARLTEASPDVVLMDLYQLHAER